MFYWWIAYLTALETALKRSVGNVIYVDFENRRRI
jgi:hypothetical protein